MVALDPPVVNFVPLVSATRKLRTVPLDCDTILAGRDLGICFGDEYEDQSSASGMG
jgi:6-phosphofructokinase 1